MNLSEKHNIKWENRYNVLSIEARHKVIEKLIEPFKKRGVERKELIDAHPRLINENGKPTERLVIINNKYIDGHIIENGFDESGAYSIFQAKNSTKNEQWKEIIEKREKLSFLAKKQRKLLESDITFSDIQTTKNEIDTLFLEIFGIENTNIKKTTSENPELPKYCEIGSLFAQGFLHLKENHPYFKKERFKSYSQLAKHIRSEVLENDTGVRQYISDTLSGSGQKNFYQSKGMMKKVVEYCQLKNIKITEEFQSKNNDLNNLH